MKVGDKVRCKPGFNTEEPYQNNNGGGSGYVSGKEFTIGRITQHNTKPHLRIMWPKGNDQYRGIYEHALELVNNDNYQIY